MRMAQYISHLTNVPLMECMESQHEPHTSEAMGLYLPPGPAMLTKKARIPFQGEVFTSPADSV